LYTEMVTTGALLHGDVARHLDHDPAEHPLALQIGGSEPHDLAKAAQLGERWGYREINLNCGCPSERVQRGAFGACLMAEPALVADGIKAAAPGRTAAWGSVYVKVRLGGTLWQTSVFPSKEAGGYLLPVKAIVRKMEGVGEGDVVTVELSL
jgi:tRNA-dihydrouridine synthase A